MPKYCGSVLNLLKQWFELYKTNQFIFLRNGNVVFCQLYDKQIVYYNKFNLQYIDTALYINASKRR